MRLLYTWLEVLKQTSSALWKWIRTIKLRYNRENKHMAAKAKLCNETLLIIRCSSFMRPEDMYLELVLRRLYSQEVSVCYLCQFINLTYYPWDSWWLISGRVTSWDFSDCYYDQKSQSTAWLTFTLILYFLTSYNYKFKNNFPSVY